MGAEGKSVMLRFTAPESHRLAVEDGEYVSGGGTVLVTPAAAEQLLAAPGISVEIVRDGRNRTDFRGMNRADLEQVASGAGLDPAKHKTKQALVAALEEIKKTAASGEGHKTSKE